MIEMRAERRRTAWPGDIHPSSSSRSSWKSSQASRPWVRWRRHGIHPNSINAWKQILLEKGPEIFSKDSTIVEYERRIAELERLLAGKRWR
jgi:hypothetical protein